MATIGDIIKTTILTEYAGSQMSNALYWEIDALGADPPLLTAALGILNAYADSIKAVCTSSWAATCIVMENLTNPEGKTIAFNTTAGESGVDGHGPDQVLRMNQYAGQPDFLKVHRGAFNQSGPHVGLSTRGRWNDLSEFDDLRTFLIGSTFVSPDWTIQAYLNWELAPGPPKVFTQTVIDDVQASGRIFKLGSRKSRLCGST